MAVSKDRIPKICRVEPISSSELLITFEDNQKKIFSVAPYVRPGVDIDMPLLNEQSFKCVRINHLGNEIILNENIIINGDEVWKAGRLLS